ncbi:MAG TPA: hypothetical protein VFB62_14135 [Polyangiaceae bacterium]|jgi:hypothetical protein|nr:hypothetical protein [Polyangiaceae bacterium]
MFVARSAVVLLCALQLCFQLGCDEPSAPPPPVAPKPAAPTAAKTVEAKVEWPQRIDEGARAALSAEAREAVDRSPVPVMVVNRAPYLAASKVIAEPNYYALSIQAEGVTVAVQASRIAHKYDHIPPQQGPARVRGIPAFTTENEKIWSATWEEFGVGYSIDVECKKLPDPRCESDRFVLELAESLVYVGGAR